MPTRVNRCVFGARPVPSPMMDMLSVQSVRLESIISFQTFQQILLAKNHAKFVKEVAGAHKVQRIV